ncbi:MAG: hypothetical protein KBT27_15395 [Prevotellaceae bacterium]|nr:hypothetical protein [Candidatus Faecinaster equi]
MAKAAFNKKYTLSATGILSIDDEIVSIENTDTGELIPLAKLMEDFADRMVKLSLNYDEDYITYLDDEQ